jgi:RecA/RadA recombinase
MSNKWIKQLRQYDDSVDFNYDSYAPENCLYSPSPYFNWIAANKSNGFPKNASILMYGPAKSGKSFSIYSMIIEMQKRDPEGIAIYFNTELRGQLQSINMAGLDKDRVVIYDTDNPVDIFDRIDKDIKPMVEDGMPLRMIIVDSISNIKGIQRLDADTIEQQLMGDQARTIKTGLSSLIPFCKKSKILFIGTVQMVANIDSGPRAPKLKAGMSNYTSHAMEYYISLSRAGAAEDKLDIEGKTFEEDDMKDARGNKLLNGHKVYVKMEASSIGAAGRSGVFTLSYDKGIVNQHEEIFWLAKNTGILKTENNRTYFFGDQKFNGKKEAALAIRDNPELAEQILNQIKDLDK